MENQQNHRFTRSEQVDMLLIFGESRKKATAACELYAERYPERRQPARSYFYKVESKFRKEPEENGDTFIVSEEAEINVLAYVEVDPTVSIRELEQQVNVSRESSRRILKKYKYRSFKYNLHQHLYENDYQRRVNYCNWFLTQQARINNFVYRILFSDESRFTNNGMFNRNNLRYWAKENPRLLRQGAFQERFGFNVWIGILGTEIIGPILFDGTLTGQRYLSFLENEIEHELTNLPAGRTRNMYFQQDGAGPHNSVIVTQYLGNRFGENWLGTHGPVRWPARSPDLTPIDFFVWGHIKNQVYSRPPTTLQNLKDRVMEAVRRINRNVLREVMRCTVHRAQLCLRENGQHFEHLIGH